MRLVLSLVAVLVTLGLGGFFFISTDKRAALQASTAASALPVSSESRKRGGCVPWASGG